MLCISKSELLVWWVWMGTSEWDERWREVPIGDESGGRGGWSPVSVYVCVRWLYCVPHKTMKSNSETGAVRFHNFCSVIKCCRQRPSARPMKRNEQRTKVATKTEQPTVWATNDKWNALLSLASIYWDWKIVTHTEIKRKRERERRARREKCESKIWLLVGKLHSIVTEPKRLMWIASPFSQSNWANLKTNFIIIGTLRMHRHSHLPLQLV